MRALTVEPILFDDSTSRDGLIEIILGMINERSQLCDRLEDQDQSLKEQESEVKTMQSRLEEAADFMADLGRIHNTPACKKNWVYGR